MNNLLAALMLFTRLPWWRIKQVPSECFKHAVSYWSFAGWLTGGAMALTFWLAQLVLPVSVAVVLALAARLLLTGALHEDGYADFFDGFGGGHDREAVLRIMKDSHIGSYGVISLIVYYLMAFALLSSMPAELTPFVMLAGDAWCKWVASRIVNCLPYCRREEESKTKTVYTPLSIRETIVALIGGALPLFFLPVGLLPACVLPVIAFIGLVFYMRHRIQGYTGDCCGASFIMCELSFWVAALILINHPITL